jgi:signal transduction histidine kinase
MGGNSSAESGSTRRSGKGFPQLNRGAGVYRLRRTALAGIALVGFFTATLATTTAIEGHPDAGVVIATSGQVESVSPSGFAWRDGVRPGQIVVASAPSDAFDGWSLSTIGPHGPITSREAPVLEALRATLPFALLGLAAACLAIAFVRLNRSWVLPSSSLALIGASVPMYPANHSLSPFVLASAALVPALCVAYDHRGSRWLALVIAGGAAGLVGCWAVNFASGGEGDQLEEARRGLALAGTGLLMVDRVVRNGVTRPSTPQATAVLVSAVVVSVGLALVYFAAFPAPLMAIGIVVVVLAIPPIRSLLGRRLELALVADLREQVAADVADEERGRLARELHDQPLQELAAAIRRLELVPEARAETTSLLAVAEQLRAVAVDLRPPMLDDIGVAAAIDFLAEQVSSPAVPVVINIEDTTGLERSSRPPAAVEFAVYRIAREAITNALRHARASVVTVSGRIGLEAIDLEVVDDGVGLASTDTRRASGRGRLGLASMRRRAQGIGAEISIEGSPGGTRVAVLWRA